MSYKTALMTIPEINWGDEELVASFNNGKLYWGKPIAVEATGENYMATMQYCSQQMEALAKTRGSVKTVWDNMQTKAWTKLRAEAAKSYLETDRCQDMMEHIDALQWEIDGATSVGDKAEYHRLIVKIEPLRKEIARIEKWARDLEKLD